MGLQQIPYVPVSAEGPHTQRTIGHSHFWDRAMSRRNMLLGTAAAAGVMVGGRIVPPRFGTLAGAASTTRDPKPIPGGILVLDEQRYHAYVPGRANPLDPTSPINEPSTITDFDGVVAITQTQGKGTGVEHGVDVPLTFDADMRFMAGRYVGKDGQIHQGQFGFI
jgi:hypothetical protein